MGHALESRPGEEPQIHPRGMPLGTSIEVSHLFANVPARRKFMRSEATEVGHCSDAVIRVSLVHPGVSFTVRHGGRRLLHLSAGTLEQRIEQLLERRGPGPYHFHEGEVDGVRVRVWLGPPASASRNRKGPFIVVRRRVVKDRSLAQIVGQAYGDRIASGRQPVAALLVDPPPGTVDVNVHPQKAEVRFADAQGVYAAARTVLNEAAAGAPWSAPVSAAAAGGAAGEEGPEMSWGASPSAASWREPVPRDGGRAEARSYRLGTRAAGGGYAEHKASLRREAEQLRARLPQRGDKTSAAAGWANPAGAMADRAPEASAAEPAPVPSGPELLTCLPGPVAVFRDGDDLLAVDLRRLRAHLVYRRLAGELGGEGVPAQGLLPPAVVRRSPEVCRLLLGAAETLETIGIVLESFGDDAVLVRAVPAAVRSCVDEADVEDLVDRLVPWLRLREGGGERAKPDGALEAVARTRGRDPGPRLARRWMRELLDAGVDLDATPGIRRWRVAELSRVD